MPILNAADLQNLRTRPVGRNWQLYVFQPATTWSGTVGGAPSQGDRALTVATVAGNPLNIRADSTLRITNAAGAEKNYPSRVRIRSYNPVGPVLTVADNDIDWVAGDRIYAMRLFELWPRYVYIDPATGTQYKDRDIAWVNDATAQPPKANAGPAAIATLVGGQADVIFADNGSFAVPAGGAVASHLWGTYGGAPAVVAGGLATATVTLRYTTAGYYYVSLTVTDANGITAIRWVPVIIDDGTLGRRVESSGRQWDKYGWTLSRDLLGIDADDSFFYDGAPTFLAADTQMTAEGAFADNRSNLRWSGWLMEDRTTRPYYRRRINYRAVSSAHILNSIPAFPVGVRSDAAPVDWYELTALCLDSVCFHLMHWHSTAMQVCDYYATGEWATRLRPGENCRADDLLGQVDDVLHACYGNLRCDRQGMLRAMRDEWHLSAAERAARAVVLTLDDSDWLEITYGPRKHRAVVSSLRMLGVDGASNPYMSGSPGDAPLEGGRPHEVQKLSPINQAELNRWAGQELAVQNWQWIVRMKFSGEGDVVDPALGEFVEANMDLWDDKLPEGPFSVIGVRYTDDHAGGLTMGEWELLPDPGEAAGETRPIPVVPDAPIPDPLPIDPIPIIPAIDWPEEVWVGTVDKGVYYSTDFTGPDGAMPTWTQFNTGLPALGAVDWLYQFEYDRANPADDRFFALITDGNTAYPESTGPGGYEVYRTETGGNWSLVMDLTDAAAVVGVAAVAGAHLDWVSVDEITGRVWIAFNTGNVGAGAVRAILLYSDLNGDSGVGNWNFYEPATAAKYFYPGDNMCVRAYNGNILFFAHASPGGIGAAEHNMYWSLNNGVAWNFQIINTTTTLWDFCGGAQDPLNPLIGYGRDFPAAAFDMVKVTTASSTVINDSDDLNTLPDVFWFSRVNSGTIRGLKQGDIVGVTYPQLIQTTNAFITPATLTAMPYLNIANMADFVNAQTDYYLIYGARDCDSLAANITEHHVLVADAYFDPTDLYAKAGDNVGTPPYTDSIPEDAGGGCWDSVQVVG